ncbi:MAG: HEAT repeat domain-containing protein [bacterium]
MKTRCSACILMVFRFAPAILALPLVAGCAGSLGTTARSMLANVRQDQDPNKRFKAYQKLGRTGTYDNTEQLGESVAELSKRLMEGKEPPISRAVICRSLGRLKHAEARDALVKAMDDPDEEVRCEAARALGHVGKPEDAVLLARMMAIDPTHNGRVAAAEGLSSLKPQEPRILISLTENLNNDDPAIRLAAYRALKSITGADPGSDANTWHEYLAKNKPGYVDDPVVAQATQKPAAKAGLDPAIAKASGSPPQLPAGPASSPFPPAAPGLANP